MGSRWGLTCLWGTGGIPGLSVGSPWGSWCLPGVLVGAGLSLRSRYGLLSLQSLGGVCGLSVGSQWGIMCLGCGFPHLPQQVGGGAGDLVPRGPHPGKACGKKGEGPSSGGTHAVPPSFARWIGAQVQIFHHTLDIRQLVHS